MKNFDGSNRIFEGVLQGSQRIEKGFPAGYDHFPMSRLTVK